MNIIWAAFKILRDAIIYYVCLYLCDIIFNTEICSINTVIGITIFFTLLGVVKNISYRLLNNRNIVYKIVLDTVINSVIICAGIYVIDTWFSVEAISKGTIIFIAFIISVIDNVNFFNNSDEKVINNKI